MDNSHQSLTDSVSAPVSGMGLLANSLTETENTLDLTKEISVSVANTCWARKGQWSTAIISREEFINELTNHKIGSKDGPCFLQGELLHKERDKHLVDRNHFIGFDIDTGEPSSELIARLKALGFAFVIYSTHSHGKSTTEVTAKKLAGFVGRSQENLQLSQEEVSRFLRDDRKYHESVLANVTIDSTPIDGKFTIRHVPLSKSRVVLFLETPFEFQVDGGAKERAVAWGEYYRGVGLKLGLVFDESCVDASRLFYFPRCPNDGPKPFAAFVDGKALRLEDFDRVPKRATKPEKRVSKKPSQKRQAQAEALSVADRDRYSFGGLNLKHWTMNYDFRPVAALEAAGHHVRSDIAEGKASFQCPFHDDHSSDDDYDVGFFACDYDSTENPNKSFVMFCSHNGCQGNDRDRLDFLKGFLELGVLTVDDLKNERLAVSKVDVQEIVPLPRKAFGEFEYRRFDDAIWCYRKAKKEKDSSENEDERLFSPIDLDVGIKIGGIDGIEGRRLSVMQPDKTLKSIDFGKGDLDKLSGKEILQRLREIGALFTEEGEKFLMRYLKQTNPYEYVVTTRIPGWHGATYLSPLGDVFGEVANLELEQGYGCQNKSKSGTLELWKAAATAACESGNNHLVFGLFAGCAGAVVQLAGLDNAAIAFSGTTSRGKSTAQKLSASQVAKPDLKENNVYRSLKTTDNAAELMFAIGNGSSIHLDEAQHMGGRELQKVIFMFSGGAGKSRSTHSQSLKQSVTYSTFCSVSGEIGLERKISSDGGNAAGGTHVRIFEVNVDDAKTLEPSVLEKLALCETNYGHALPEFVKALIAQGYVADPSRLRKRIAERAEKLAGVNPTPAYGRAAKIPALLGECGVIMQDAGLLPNTLDVDDVIEWAWKQHETQFEPVDRAIAKLREALATGAGVVALADSDDRKPFAGVTAYFDDDFYFIVPDSLFSLSGCIVGASEVAKKLKAMGMLEPAKGKNNVHKTIQSATRPKYAGAKKQSLVVDHYRIKKSFMTDASSEGGEGA